MITQKHLNNISNLSIEDQSIIVDHCANNLGLMTVSEYASKIGKSTRTIYRNIDKYPTITICNTAYICSNVTIET